MRLPCLILCIFHFFFEVIQLDAVKCDVLPVSVFDVQVKNLIFNVVILFFAANFGGRFGRVDGRAVADVGVDHALV